MTEKEQAALRAVYQQWPVERLARAATHEKGDYEPVAVALMLDELKKRGVAEEELTKFSASLPPPITQEKEERDTRMLPARLNRKQYAIRWFVWVVALVAIGASLELLPALQPGAFVIWVFAGLIYKIVALDIPRIKNAGMSPWLLLLFLVPLANLVLFVLLFAAPPKK
jgi:hypothetical protein